MDHAVDDPATVDRLLGKRALQTEPYRAGGKRGFDFSHHENEVADIAIDEIPMIGEKLVMHVVDEAPWTVQVDLLLPPYEQSQQAIESDEVIHMRMRDKDVLEALNFARRERGDIAQVEQDRAPLEQRLDIERRVPGPPVDETRMQNWPHEVR